MSSTVCLVLSGPLHAHSLASTRGSGRRDRSRSSTLYPGQQSGRNAPARLQVAACHRCLLEVQHRQPIPPLQQRLPPLHGSSRGRSLAAAAEKGSNTQHVDPGQDDAQLQQAAAQQESEQAQQEDSAGVRAALAMLKFYKAAISPLLPPACRYLPTCSAYSMDAFKQHGVTKGFVLTAWRLLRCNPWGGRGYDPVRWPPPGLEFIFPADDTDTDGSGPNKLN